MSRPRRRPPWNQWFRVFYRSGASDLALGEADLARLLARKVPGAIHHEKAQIYRCLQCPKVGPWTPEWIGYPIWDRIRDHHPGAKEEEATFCSSACWITYTGGFDVPEWMDLHREPRPDRERNAALIQARYLDKDRERSTRAHRTCPLPPWKGRGWCRWCEAMILYESGPKAGRQNKHRHWHPACAIEYGLHSEASAQMDYLAERDGMKCADCGQGAQLARSELGDHPWRGDRETRWGYNRWKMDLPEIAPGIRLGGCCYVGWQHDLEVDHDTPLWKVRDLPAEERLPFYGPKNLRLRCKACHKAKSAREAAERAAERRLEAAQRKLQL